MASVDQPAPLSVYRPSLDRLILGVSLLGVLLAVHLWFQQSQGFEAGCTGFADGSAPSLFDCGAVVGSAAGTFLGVSNTIWGLLFYLAVAALTAAVDVRPTGPVRALKQVRLGLVGVGFVYQAYLTIYQFTALDARCLLCLVSAFLVLLLTILVIRDLRQPIATPKRQVKPVADTRLVAALGVVTALLVVGDLLYFQRQGPLGEVAVVTLPNGQECAYATELDALEAYDTAVTPMDPYTGSAEAPVTLIEYFDPNCPHCRTQQPIMESIIRTYGDQIRVVYKPIPLWGHSVPQVAALYEAAQQGKFFEMIEAQFSRQDPRNGLPLPALQQIAAEIGMDVEALTQAVEGGEFDAYMQQQRGQLGSLGERLSVPTVLVNGRPVRTKSEACLQGFIEHAASTAL